MQGIRYPKPSISEMEAKIQVIFSYRMSLKAAWDKQILQCKEEQKGG